MTNDTVQMIKDKLPFLKHPQSELQFSWNCAQLGLLILPLSPFFGGIFLGLALLGTWVRKYRTIIHRPQNLGFALFSLLLLISTAFAFDRQEAIIGLFNLLPFILLFSAFSILIQTPAQLRRLSWILVITSVPVVIIGWGQLFCGWSTGQQWESALGWAIALGGNPPGRMASIFMYANTLAAYLLIVFILGLGLWLENYLYEKPRSRSVPDGIRAGLQQLQIDKKTQNANSRQDCAKIRQLRSQFSETSRGRVACRMALERVYAVLASEGYYAKSFSFLFLSTVVIANFVALILTDSRNGWAIAFFACLAYAFYQGWYMLVAGVTGLITSVLLAAFAPLSIANVFRQIIPAHFWARLNDQLYPDRPVGLLRKTQWEFAWSMTQQRPWTGWGLRNFTPLYQTQTHLWLGHPHNLFLMLSAEIGLPATVLFCALLSWIFLGGIQVLYSSKYLQAKDKLIFFSYLLVFGAWILFNTADVTIFDFRLNTLFWLLLGAISGIVYRCKS
jgi:hypothetical protein